MIIVNADRWPKMDWKPEDWPILLEFSSDDPALEKMQQAKVGDLLLVERHGEKVGPVRVIEVFEMALGVEAAAD